VVERPDSWNGFKLEQIRGMKSKCSIVPEVNDENSQALGSHSSFLSQMLMEKGSILAITSPKASEFDQIQSNTLD